MWTYLSSQAKEYRPCTTDSKHRLPVAENVLAQDFSTSAPNEKWGGDITYVSTAEGFLYFAVILDFFSRKVVGRAGGDSLHSRLCCDALKMALLRRRPPSEIIHHSDRAVQYASAEYTQLVRENAFTQSMSRKGNCYDNAMVESFFHTLKVELVNRKRYATRQEALDDITDYIENFYNVRRIHSSLDYCSPNEYQTQCRIAA